MTAELLEKPAYRMIHRAMLRSSDAPSAVLDIMPSGRLERLWENDFDTSLSRQLSHVMSRGRPEVVVLTANSAIPIADCFRSYFEQRGLPCPSLIAIRANRRVAREHFDGAPPWARYQHDQEVQRLRGLVAGRTTCLVDQFVNSGCTVRYGGQLLLEAGAENLMAIRGRWYEHASQVDGAQLTSDHQEFMRAVGVALAQVCDAEIV